MFSPRLLRNFIGIAISIVFIYLLWQRFAALQQVEWRSVISSIKPGYFIAGMGLMVASTFFQALRWQYILSPMGKFSVGQTVQSVWLGHFVNFILPMRAGEVAKPYHFATKNQQVFFKVAGTCITERLYDAMAVLFLLVYCVAFLFAANPMVMPLVTASAYVIVLIVLFVIIRRRWVPSFFWGLVPGTGFRKYLQTRAGELSEAFAFKYSSKTFAGIWASTIIIWCINILSYWLILLSCDLPVGLYGFNAAIAVTIGSAIAHSIPAAASGIGVLNYSVIFALESYGNTLHIDSTAISAQLLVASLVVYLSVIIPDILLGGIVYLRDRKILTLLPGKVADQ